MNHRPILMASALGASILLATTQYTTSPSEIALADFKDVNQTLDIALAMNVIEFSAQSRSFERLSAEIVEVSPWLKPENQSLRIDNDRLISVLSAAGFSGQSLRYAWAVVMKESTRYIYAHNDNSSTGDDSFGLFQINMRGSLEDARLKRYGLSQKEDLFDPLTNALAAWDISDGGTDWSPWHATNKDKIEYFLTQFPG